MYNHRPENYINPFKHIVEGKENKDMQSRQSDVVYHDKDITAFVGSNSWPYNKGIIIVVPNEEYENLYDLPDKINAKINILAKYIAIAMRETYPCEGVSTRQHNEPAGNQEVWHYHLQIFPRYPDDDIYGNYKNKIKNTPEETFIYAEKLKTHFTSNPITFEI